MTQKQDAAEATIAPEVARRSQHQRDKRGSWAYYNHLGKDDAHEQIHR